ncbi:hypothetical protein ACYX7E_01850 [Luteimonas sp. RIT-PG2_3]
MTTEVEYAAATALFSVVSNRDNARNLGQEELFDLYQVCLEIITGRRRPTRRMTFSTQCPACAEKVDIERVVPVVA